MSSTSLSELGSMLALVNERVSFKKDPSKQYLGLEHIPSNGSRPLGTASATDSISTNNQFRDGDILFGKLRPRLHKSIRVGFSGYCSTDILVLRTIEPNCPAFAGYTAQSDGVFASAIRTEEGTKMPRCSWSDVRKVKVYSPTPSEQNDIAQVLTTIDEAIEQTEALIAKTQKIKAGLMHDLFTRGVTENGELRPPRSEAPHLYKESPLGWIPREWELSQLAAKRSPNRSHLKTGPFGSSLKGEHWVEFGRPVITIGALGEGGFIHSELLFVSESTASWLSEYQLSIGDVVFSRVADVGRSAVIEEEQEGWIMSSNLMRISLDQKKIVPSFLQAQLAYDSRIRQQIRATVNSGGRDVANSQILNRLQFVWPLLEEQQQIVERLKSIEEVRKVVTISLSCFGAIKSGLMHDLLTGKVRVPEGAVRV